MRLLFPILCGLLIGIPLAIAEKQPAKKPTYVKAVVSGVGQSEAYKYKFVLKGKHAQALAEEFDGMEKIITSETIEPPTPKKFGTVIFTRDDDTELKISYNDSVWQREDSFPVEWATGDRHYLDKLIAQHKEPLGTLPR